MWLRAHVRIAFMTNLFPPIQTGSAYWTQQAVLALVARGHEVIVITCAPSGSSVGVEDLGGARVYRLPPRLRFPKLKALLNFDQFYLIASRENGERAEQIMREERVQIVHQAGHLLDSTLLSLRVARNLGIPAVCSIHTRIGHPTSRIYDLLMRTTDRLFLGPRLMRRFDRLMALDTVLLRHYARLYSVDRIACVPVCVEDAMLDMPAADPPDEGEVRLVSVGHVTEMRDRRELLHAVADLVARGFNVRLDIVGKVLTDVTARLIRELALDSVVTLHGEMPREELLGVLRASSLEVHWIDVQGIGLAAMEAMALGVPVAVWSDEGIYGDVPLRHLDNIVFIDPQDRDSLVNTLSLLVQDRDLRARIGINGREVVRRHLTWRTVAQQLETLYSEAIAAS